eukprot:scaffold6842_cov165-Alexandrium_tamarense.AAC.3
MLPPSPSLDTSMTRRFLFSLLALLGEASTRRAPLTSAAFVPSQKHVGVAPSSLPKHTSYHSPQPINSSRKSPWSYLSLQNEDDVTITASTGNSEVEEDIKLPNTFFQRERPKDINSDTFGQLLPIAKAVDEATGGWGLSYAGGCLVVSCDLHPVTPRTTVGQAFLATNFCYAAGGLAITACSRLFPPFFTTFNRSALITGGVYMIQAGIDAVPVEALLTAGGSVICLSLCWVWEFGYPYIFWHSLWHILSALTGYLIGQEHISTLV